MMLARKTQKMNDKKPDKTKPAATILLLRDVADHLEVLMIVRSDKMHFQSALVFPGGKIDDSDNDPDLAPYIGGAEGLSPKQRATRVGAIREAFEEAGILLARPRDGDTLVDAARLKDLRPRYRKDLFEGKISLREMAEKENLVFACDQLADDEERVNVLGRLFGCQLPGARRYRLETSASFPHPAGDEYWQRQQRREHSQPPQHRGPPGSNLALTAG